MYGKIIAAGLAVAACLNGADAHAYMSRPTPRALTIPGHKFRYEPQSDGAWEGDCQDNGQIGPIQATYYEGDVITVAAHITAHHNGEYQLRFCANPYGTNSCLSQTLAKPLQPANKILAQSVDGSRSGLWDAQFQLPEGLVCDNCVMQFWYQNNNGVREHFKSCHDVRILPRDGAAPPTQPPVMSSSSTTTTTTSSSVPPPVSGDECKCTAISPVVTDAWCNPSSGINMCVPDYELYCQRICSEAPPATSSPVPSTTSTPSSSSLVPVVTITSTVTVTEECYN